LGRTHLLKFYLEINKLLLFIKSWHARCSTSGQNKETPTKNNGGTKMKKTLAIAMAVALIGGLASFASARGGWGGGPMMWDGDSDYGRGRHMYSRDFDGRGRGYGPGYCRSNSDRTRALGGVDKADTAAEIVADRLEAAGNPNLEVGKITEVGRDFEVEIVTKDGSLANKVLVEKSTGRILSAYNN
jgi:hypothetical protein